MSGAGNSAEAAREPRRVLGRPFRKGVSGNPSGRPQHSMDVAALARQHTVAAIAALAKALNDPRTRVPAAVALLNRGYGMPAQPITGEGPQSLSVLHLVAAKEVTEEIQLALAAANGTASPTIEGEPSQNPEAASADIAGDRSVNLYAPAPE
jgi:hypothetical protein